MLPPWRAEKRIGLCPDRLVLGKSVVPVEKDPVGDLRRHVQADTVTVVLSNHFVRYAVLSWSDSLSSEVEWLAYARHTFDAIYGAAASGWEVRVSPGRRGEARIASGVDASLLQSLRALPKLASIQPYLMCAFNKGRMAFPGTAWFVLHETGRLTLALIEGGIWKAVRGRQVDGDWMRALPDLLDRESALLGGTQCDQVFVRAEVAVPSRLGRYRITDVTPGNSASRSCAMVLH